MSDRPTDPDPFGGMTQDARDRLPPPTTAGQAASAFTGFIVMGIGGIVVGAGVLGYVAKSPFAIMALPGLGICYLGYWLYNRSRKRVRRAPRASRNPDDEL